MVNMRWIPVKHEIEIIIAGVIAKPEWVDTGFEARQVVTALKRGKAYEMSNILFLELEKDIKGKKRSFALSLVLFVNDQSESNFFSLWYINKYLNIRRGC